MYSADASGTQYVWDKVPAEEGDFVLYTDAQATIAALQAELERTKFEMASELELQVNAVVREREQLKAKLTQRTAELERVTGELVETSLYLQQERANRDSLAACVDRDVKTIKELRTLIAALPKVEVITSDTVVNIVQQYNFHRWMLRALQHRQGMEGDRKSVV